MENSTNLNIKEPNLCTRIAIFLPDMHGLHKKIQQKFNKFGLP